MTVMFRFGGYQGERSVHTRALRLLAAALERHLGEGTEVALTANVTDHGHKAADVLGMVAKGEMDVCYFQSSYLDTVKVPALRALDLPFVMTDRARIYPKLDGELGARIAAAVAAATPYRVLTYWDNGFRHISNSVRPIRNPADCAGLSIRTTASLLHQDIFAAFGFKPVFVDPADLPGAVASGAVDAQENPLTNLVNFGIHRHHKHVSMTSHFFGCSPLLINKTRYAALPMMVRDSLHAAVAEATAAQRGFAQAEDAECRKTILDAGAKIIEAGEIDFPAFKTASRAVVEREAVVIDEDVMAELER